LTEWLAFAEDSKYEETMSITGIVKNGVIILPPGAKVPDGTEVRIEAIEDSVAEDPFVVAVVRHARPRPHLPSDYALNHGHYVRGEPKR
jgi:hypothetical protein